MAKALLGAVASPVDARLLAEVRALRRRVAVLEAEVAHLQATAEAREVLAALERDAALLPA